MRWLKKMIVWASFAGLLSGCATMNLSTGFSDVGSTVEQRTGIKLSGITEPSSTAKPRRTSANL